MTTPSAAVRFAVLAAVRAAAHQLGDYWVQTDQQAMNKGRRGLRGSAACARHVAAYSAVNAAVIAVANRAFGLGLTRRGILLGELVSALTHYAADRRDHGLLFPAARALGKDGFLDRGGAALLDQAWHTIANTAAAAVTAVADHDS